MVHTINRRTVLKSVGAGAIGTTVATGSVGAETHSAIDEIKFCGCSQVCVDSSVPKDVYIAWETDNGWKCGRPNSGGDLGLGSTFCFELTEETRDDLGLPDDAKIIGIEDKNRVFCNPNPCAQKAISEFTTNGSPCQQDEFNCLDPDDFGIEVTDCQGLGKWKKEHGVDTEE